MGVLDGDELFGLQAFAAIADIAAVKRFGVDEAAIAAWDISILPDGTGLPKGSGTPAQGVLSCAIDAGERQAPFSSPLNRMIVRHASSNRSWTSTASPRSMRFEIVVIGNTTIVVS